MEPNESTPGENQPESNPPQANPQGTPVQDTTPPEATDLNPDENPELEKGLGEQPNKPDLLPEEQYEADKAEFADGYVRYNQMTPEEKDSDEGQQLIERLSELHASIVAHDGGAAAELAAQFPEADVILANTLPKLADPDGEFHAQEHPQYDPTNKVILSNAPFDGYDKDELTTIVNESQLTSYHKDKLLAQINAGKIEPDYTDAVKSMINAHKAGTIYRPGQGGL